ncbi:MAG: hypothetical protein LHV68_12835 [Elusimicrobia bacterium]|nr:hypothetical protein [Candidatus Liberimonas magnetica]
MIEKKTIFVLGAGASMPYGYPSGAELLDALVDKNIINVYPILDLGDVNINVFRKTLRYAYPSSIDYFLMQNKDNQSFIKYGKAAIIRYFLKKEYRDAGTKIGGIEELSLPRNKDNKDENKKWYGYFFNNILAMKSFKDLFKNNVTIVTFNYDRSFECFTYNHLKNTYGASDFDIYLFFKHINYSHVYGCIAPIFYVGNEPYYDFSGDFKEEDDLRFIFNNDTHAWQYGKVSDDTLKNYSSEADRLLLNRIKVIGEERDSKTPVLSEEILTDAQYLCFLGFAYDETNMDRLNLKLLNLKCHVSGTILDIPIHKLEYIAKYFLKNGKKNKRSEHFYYLINEKRLDLIKEDDIISYFKYRFYPIMDDPNSIL